MTPQQAVGLACRLFAIWLALGSFQSWMVVRAAQTEGIAHAEWVRYAVPGIYWIVAVVLWFFPMSVAHRLLPRTRHEDRMKLPTQQVLVVACAVLGLMVVVLRALPAIVAWTASAVLWVGQGETLSTMAAMRHADLLEGLLQFGVGVALVVKAHPVAALVVPPPGREHVSPSMLGDSAL